MTDTDYLTWLDSITLKERCIHDRAYGQAFYENKTKEERMAAGRAAVAKAKKERTDQ